MKPTHRVRALHIATMVGTMALIVVFFAAVGFAQEPQEHWYTFNAGGGYTPLVGAASTRLNNGWNATGGIGFRLSSHFELDGQFMYSGLGVSSFLLAEAAAPSGNAHIWSVSADPHFRFGGAHRFDPYIVVGVGYYRRTVDFTSPGVPPAAIPDPFFGNSGSAAFPGSGINLPGSSVTSTASSFSASGVGGSAGAGFHIRLGQSTAKLFAEARYHYAATGSMPTRMIPVTVGIRW